MYVRYGIDIDIGQALAVFRSPSLHICTSLSEGDGAVVSSKLPLEFWGRESLSRSGKGNNDRFLVCYSPDSQGMRASFYSR